MARTSPPPASESEVGKLAELLKQKASETGLRRVFLSTKELDSVLDEKGNINRVRHILVPLLKTRNITPTFTSVSGVKGYNFDVPSNFVGVAPKAKPSRSMASRPQQNRGSVDTLTHFSTKYIIPDIFADVRAAVDHGRSVLVIGPPGCGKSRMLEEIAAAMGTEAIRRPLSQVADPAELTGYLHIKEKNGVSVTEFVDGTITSCARNGKILILDEFDNATPAANEALKQITEDGGSIVVETENGTEVVPRHPDFRICFTANTDCRGDSKGLFPNASIQNRATLDRLRPKFYMDYQYEIEERTILDIGLPKSVVEALYAKSANAEKKGLVYLIRDALRENGVADFLGFRAIIAFAEDFNMFGWNKSFLYHIVHDFDEEFQQTVKGIVRSRLGEWAEPTRDADMLKKHQQERQKNGFVPAEVSV